MFKNKTYSLFKILVTIFWVIAGAGTVVLLIAAMNKKNSMRCKSVEITIKGVQNNYFIDKQDVRQIIENINNGKLEGVPMSKFNLQMMEAALRKNIWIKRAELFFDNNEHLKVEVLEREPVARIFTDKGNSFYVDSSIHVLPLSDKSSARIPVFTGFVETSSFSKSDSLLLKDIAVLGEYILNDPFWMAQIEQIDIQPARQFEMIPKIGNQVIIFGDVNAYKEKFDKLLMFYQKVISKSGWNKYSRINVQYQNQVIGVKRDAEDIAVDSIRTLLIMQAIVANNQARVNDSINNIQLAAEEQQDLQAVEAVERDEFTDDGTTPNDIIITKPILNESKREKAPVTNANPKPSPSESVAPAKKIVQQLPKPVTGSSLHNSAGKKITVKKPAEKKPKPSATPKAVMPPKNDY